MSAPSADEFQAAAWPICARGTARVLVAGLYRRDAPHVDAGRLGQWDRGQVLAVWAEVDAWVLLQDLATNAVAWSHRGTTANPYLELALDPPIEPEKDSVNQSNQGQPQLARNQRSIQPEAYP